MRQRIRSVIHIIKETFGEEPCTILQDDGKVYFRLNVKSTEENRIKFREALDKAGFDRAVIRNSSYVDNLKNLKILKNDELTWEEKIRITEEVLLFYRKSYNLSKKDSMSLWNIRQAIKGFPVCNECNQPMQLADVKDTNEELYRCKNNHTYVVRPEIDELPICDECGNNLPLVSIEHGVQIYGQCRHRSCRIVPVSAVANLRKLNAVS